MSEPIGVVAPGQLGFDPGSYLVNEGDGTVTLTVARTGGADGTVLVSYTTVDGTATEPGDYQTTAATLTFGDGVTSQTIVVPITSDAVPEPSEAFTVMLFDSVGGATLGNDTATVTIASHLPAVPIPTASTWTLLILTLTLAVIAAGSVRA